MERFRIGSRVVVKGHESAGERVVVSTYSDIKGGRRLDAPVAGFVSWNVADLRKAPPHYVIDTDKPTNGPWRETSTGNRYASVTMADGRRFHVGVERDKRVRIPYKPRGANWGWTYYGFVRDAATGKTIADDTVIGSLGVRGLLRMAGLLDATVVTAPKCSCGSSLDSQMDCRVHGISAQLDRTQME